MAAGWAQLHYANGRSTVSRSTDEILRPSLVNAHPDKEKCLKMFASNKHLVYCIMVCRRGTVTSAMPI